MIHTLLLPDLKEMLAENDVTGLSEFCTALYPADCAEVLEFLDDVDVWRVLMHSPLERQVEIFEFFNLKRQARLVEGLDQERLSNLLQAMSSDDRVDLLGELEDDAVERVLPLIAKAERNDIRRLLSYPEDSAGALMTTDYASLPEGLTVAEALVQLRLQAPDRETIYYVYVLDSQRRLKGFVSLRKLILAKTNAQLSDVMEHDIIRVQVTDDQELVVQLLARYDFIALPVVDEQNHLVGIVTHDDVLDVVVEEATEDVLRLGGVGSLEESHLDAPFVTVWYERTKWLLCLFIAELFTFSALSQFTETIDAVLVLSLFVPLCISTGGNSGSQAATLICRAMALGRIEPGDWWRVLKHELGMGLALGATLGVVGYIRAAVTPASVLGNAERFRLATVIGLAVSLICLWGTVVGSLLPLLFKRLGVDPAYASSPFVATFVDVTGIFIYLGIATAILIR